MAKCSEIFVGIDTAKMRHALAFADAGPVGGTVLGCGKIVLPHIQVRPLSASALFAWVKRGRIGPAYLINVIAEHRGREHDGFVELPRVRG